VENGKRGKGSKEKGVKAKRGIERKGWTNSTGKMESEKGRKRGR